MLLPVLPLLCIATVAILVSLCTADIVQYIVYPVIILSSEDSETLESLLKELAGDAKLVYTSWRFDQPTPAYWLAKLPESAFATVEKNRFVNAKGLELLAPKLMCDRFDSFVVTNLSRSSARRSTRSK